MLAQPTTTRSQNVEGTMAFDGLERIFGFNPIEKGGYLKSFNKRVLVL
jgi:hypothetical protein